MKMVDGFSEEFMKGLAKFLLEELIT